MKSETRTKVIRAVTVVFVTVMIVLLVVIYSFPSLGS